MNTQKPKVLDSLFIDWKTNLNCNLKCTYCCQKNQEKNLFHPSVSQINNAVSVFSQFKYHKLNFSIAGGEPTLFPELRYLLSRLNALDNLGNVDVITNCKKDDNYFKSLFVGLPPQHFRLYFSIHPEYFNNNLKLLEGKIRQLTHNNINFFVAVMYRGSIDDNLVNTVDSLQNELGFPAKIVMLRTGKLLETIFEYSDPEITQVFKTNLLWNTRKRKYYSLEDIIDHNVVLSSGVLHTTGMYCIHGLTVLSINLDGTCCGAICGNANPSNFSVYNGINPFKFKSFIKIHKCSCNLCGCRDNLIIPKFKKMKDAEMYLQDVLE